MINPATLKLIADPKTKFYGNEDPILSFKSQGLKGNDTVDLLSGSLSRDSGEIPGKYPIKQGTLSANSNYKVEFTENILEILPVRVLSLVEFGTIETSWSLDPVLPKSVQILTTDGQFFTVEVVWDVTNLNVFSRGSYLLKGELNLPLGIENPDNLMSSVVVKVLPKPAPIDVTLSSSSFVGSTTEFFISIGAFQISDSVDKIHTVTLLGEGYDNPYFEIKDNVLFWSSSDRGEGKTKFTIVVRVLDRDGNTLDKFMEITRVRPSVSSIEIFNTFSPDRDQFNDAWGVDELRFYGGVRIQVFERGGQRVFSTDNPDVKWDGTFEGKDLPVGAYYWIVEVAETGEIRKGMLNLIRK